MAVRSTCEALLFFFLLCVGESVTPDGFASETDGESAVVTPGTLIPHIFYE